MSGTDGTSDRTRRLPPSRTVPADRGDQLLGVEGTR